MDYLNPLIHQPLIHFFGLKYCFWGQFVTKGHDVDSVMSELVNYNRSPEYVSEEVSLTVRETSEISGKSIMTLGIPSFEIARPRPQDTL